MLTTKKVNVSAPTMVTNTHPQLYGFVPNVTLTLEDILKCLVRRGVTVDEILNDGSTIRLNLKNYMNNNNPVKAAEKEEEIPADAAVQAVEDDEKHDDPKYDGTDDPDAEEEATGEDFAEGTPVDDDHKAVETSDTTDVDESADEATADTEASTTDAEAAPVSTETADTKTTKGKKSK